MKGLDFYIFTIIGKKTYKYYFDRSFIPGLPTPVFTEPLKSSKDKRIVMFLTSKMYFADV